MPVLKMCDFHSQQENEVTTVMNVILVIHQAFNVQGKKKKKNYSETKICFRMLMNLMK